jgi:hypothetical protein
MREFCEFRVVEDFAPMLFAENEGKKLGGTVRKVELRSDDPRFARIGELQHEIRKNKGRSFFHGWILRRKYTRSELAAAAYFKLLVTNTFEPAGEECGTKYDETSACKQCGAGANQITDLFLNWRKIPKGKDICRTIAGEIVASRRLKEFFHEQQITGVGFHPIRQYPSSSAESADWFQFVLTDATAKIVPPTRTGIDPFDEDSHGKCRCRNGDLIGLNILSEVWLDGKTLGSYDVLSSREFVGARRGLLRPERVVFISEKLWRLLESKGIKGYKIEIAHLA